MVTLGDEGAGERPYNLVMRGTQQWETGTVVDEIAEILRERIVEGRLMPRELLTQRQLANDLDVTLAVVGEAVRMLRREGLVDGVSGNVRVAIADGAALLSAHAVREVLDGLGSRLAALNAGPATERRCRAAINDHRQAISSGDRLRSMRADIAFHASIVDGSGNPVLRNQWLLVRFTTRSAMLRTPSQLGNVIDDHEAILAAVLRHDADHAESTARAHVRRTVDVLAANPTLEDQQARSP
jgi:DNA-binding GntR family transcriptional regulator